MNPQAPLETSRRFLSPYLISYLNDDIVQRFAEIRASLRRRGTSLHYDLTLLTYNVRHFQRIPDPKVVRD